MGRETYEDDQERAHWLFDLFIDSPPPAGDPAFFETISSGLSSSWGTPPPPGHGYPSKDA